jgi:hypothetical protein
MQYVERMDHSFYLYDGSFTTPPCTEGVKFIVMQEIQYITFSDIAIFQRFWGGNTRFAGGRGNNRLVQPLNGRQIFYNLVTQDERYQSLKNHFMLPDSAGTKILFSVCSTFVVIITIFVLSF